MSVVYSAPSHTGRHVFCPRLIVKHHNNIKVSYLKESCNRCGPKRPDLNIVESAWDYLKTLIQTLSPQNCGNLSRILCVFNGGFTKY